MKVRKISMICIALLLLVSAIAFADSGSPDVLTAEAWSWDPMNVNNFTGHMDLASYAGMDLTLRVTAEVEPNTEMAGANMPVFSVVNGKRIRMTMQSDSFVFTPEQGNTGFTFSGTVRMPEKIRLKKVRLTVTALKGNEELKSVSTAVDLGGSSDGQSSGAFFIPYDVWTITTILAVAAVLVWAAAIARNRLANRKK